MNQFISIRNDLEVGIKDYIRLLTGEQQMDIEYTYIEDGRLQLKCDFPNFNSLVISWCTYKNSIKTPVNSRRFGFKAIALSANTVEISILELGIIEIHKCYYCNMTGFYKLVKRTIGSDGRLKCTTVGYMVEKEDINGSQEIVGLYNKDEKGLALKHYKHAVNSRHSENRIGSIMKGRYLRNEICLLEREQIAT